MNETTKKADPRKLERLVSIALQKAGVPQGDAELTAVILVDADLRGIDSHGVINLYNYYIKGIQSGRINPNPDIQISCGSPTTASVDGDNGLGFVIGHKAMSETIRMAKDYGTGWAAVYNSNHFGAGAYYVQMAAKENMIGLLFSTGGTTVTGPGGTSRLVGNNVMAFAAPGGKHGPFVLDMAPTMAIANKLHMLQWEGKSMPEGWAVDGKGRPITDPNVYFAEKGAILPLGSTPSHGVHKGFGLLLVSDILTGLLTGDGGSMFRRKGEESHAFCALRIDAFPSGGGFADLMDEMIGKIHEAPTAEGADRMRYPGEKENEIYRERSANGIPLKQNVISGLETMCTELGLSLGDIWR
ncbi:Ldh family oxidoreductase [Paenibacillus hamazuiensis]|uniref:Ldh family oxidoreductase n=1 Tax=Paenibacillus hamazuiensis TaxID=2936508 RepID=UPI00200E2836|nr:Ldh family oxidoreductase [Paenibacillus hamazuiensis]